MIGIGKKIKKIKKIKKVKKKVRSKKAEYRELDNIWKTKVKQRDNYMCQICNKKVEGKNCHAHHILPRQFSKLRWDVANGITLCYRHHKVGKFSAHQNAIWFYGWMRANKIQQLRYLITKLTEYKE